MGSYFAITGLGNKAAGLLGEAAQDAGEMAVFGVIAAACFIVGVLLFFLVKKLKEISHGAEDNELQAPTFVEPE